MPAWVFRAGKWVYKSRGIAKPVVKKGWKKGKSGARWTYTQAKRGGQWAGTRLIGQWQKKQPDPMRPWTYRRMLGVPETLQMIQRGPRGYYEYRKQQYEFGKDLYEAYKKSRGGGSTKSSPSSWSPRGTNRTAKGGRTPHYPPRPPRGGMGGARRRRKTVPYRKGGCPPGYRYDRRRKMCVIVNS